MKDAGIVIGSAEQAKPIVFGMTRVDVHTDIEPYESTDPATGEAPEGLYQYKEKQYSISEWLEVVTNKGDTTALTVDELTYNVDESILSLEELKTYRIAKSKKNLEIWYETHPILFTDGKYYTVTATKQNLLNSNLTSYERAQQVGIDYPLKWNSTGDECTEWNYQDLLTLSFMIAVYVAPQISKQQQMEIAIKQAETIEEVMAIDIEFEDDTE